MILNRPKRSMAELTAAFTPKSSDASVEWKKFFPFWKAPVGSTSVVRFLPDLDEDNPMGFLVQNLTHEVMIDGKRKVVACAEMHGEECPFCIKAREHYSMKDAVNGKRFYRKKSYIGQVLVLETPVEHDQQQPVKLIEFGPAIFKVMQAAMTSGDLDNPPYELKGGYNFRLRKTQDGQYAGYGTSGFSPKMSDVGDDVIGDIQLFNLADHRAPKVSREELESLLSYVNVAAAPQATEEEEPEQQGVRLAASEVTSALARRRA